MRDVVVLVGRTSSAGDKIALFRSLFLGREKVRRRALTGHPRCATAPTL